MKKLISIALCIAMLMGLMCPITAFAGADDVIKVGINAEYAPFEYIEDGEFKGIDVDIIKAIADEAGYEKVEFVNMDFSELFEAVNEGVVDCAISTIMYTEERETVVDFTEPYAVAKVNCVENGKVIEKIEKYSVIFKEGAKDNPRSKYADINKEIIYWNEWKAQRFLRKVRKVLKLPKKAQSMILNLLSMQKAKF